MLKLDLSKQLKSYFSASSKPAIIDIAAAQYLSICGKGDPSETAFSKAIEALYSTAYAIKFAYKAAGSDFVVSKLEGLWWFDENKYAGKSPSNAALEVPRSEWQYRLLIMLPSFVTADAVNIAQQTVGNKKGIQLAKTCELFEMTEGKVVQMMHVGPFATEPETIQQIMLFCEKEKLGKNGHHHEIYLSDFRKTEPAKLKTILREPVRPL